MYTPRGFVIYDYELGWHHEYIVPDVEVSDGVFLLYKKLFVFYKVITDSHNDTHKPIPGIKKGMEE